MVNWSNAECFVLNTSQLLKRFGNFVFVVWIVAALGLGLRAQVEVATNAYFRAICEVLPAQILKQCGDKTVRMTAARNSTHILCQCELISNLFHLTFLVARITRVEMRGEEECRRVSDFNFCSNKSLVAEKFVALKDNGMRLENGKAGKNAGA